MPVQEIVVCHMHHKKCCTAVQVVNKLSKSHVHHIMKEYGQFYDNIW